MDDNVRARGMGITVSWCTQRGQRQRAQDVAELRDQLMRARTKGAVAVADAMLRTPYVWYQAGLRPLPARLARSQPA